MEMKNGYIFFQGNYYWRDNFFTSVIMRGRVNFNERVLKKNNDAEEDNPNMINQKVAQETSQ